MLACAIQTMHPLSKKRKGPEHLLCCQLIADCLFSCKLSQPMSTPPLPSDTYKPYPFRWIFPLGQLFLCIFLLSLINIFPGYLILRIRFGVAQGITLLNLPGAFLQIPEAMFRSSHMNWSPPGIDPRIWMALSATILGTPFWWMAGRSVEALSALRHKHLRPQINWVETVVGFLLMAGGAVMFSAGVIYGFFIDHDPVSLHLGAAGGLWALLGSLSVIARFRQRRMRKRTSTSQQTAVPTVL